MSTDAMRAALSSLIDAASNYVKPRRTTDARQVLLEQIDAARAALAHPADEPATQPDNTLVICPECCSQFRAIPAQVQDLLLDAGYAPPFMTSSRANAWQRADEPVACKHDMRWLVDGSPAECRHCGKTCAQIDATPAAPAYVPLSEIEVAQAYKEATGFALTHRLDVSQHLTRPDNMEFARAIESLVVARMRGDGK